MRTALFGAAALVLAYALPAAAQTASDTAPGATPPSGASDPAAASSSASPSTSAAPAASGSDVAAGLAVKDKTGATIGKVSDVATDAASGKKVATIQMGAETFAVDTSALAVADGAAMINASQAEIKDMIAKKKAPQ